MKIDKLKEKWEIWNKKYNVLLEQYQNNFKIKKNKLYKMNNLKSFKVKLNLKEN